MDSVHAYTVRAATRDSDLQGILSLQACNLREELTPDERREEGFVTLKHDAALLRELGTPWPHIVAVAEDTGEVAGYALVMLPGHRDRFPVLVPMFERIDELAHPGGPMANLRYYVMGQVCVAKPHRGRGLVERMYEAQRIQMSREFDIMVTEIDASNTRSLRAHAKAGCSEIDRYRSSDGREWVIVSRPLRP